MRPCCRGKFHADFTVLDALVCLQSFSLSLCVSVSTEKYLRSEPLSVEFLCASLFVPTMTYSW